MGESISSIADLKPDSRNARKHNQRNLNMIVDALHEVGAARSIVIDENGVILAGNGVVEAAADAGIERVQVVDADGETIIAVRRSGLTDKQKKRLAYYDNRTAEVAEWDAEQIAADLEAGIELGDLFDADEMSRILEGAANELLNQDLFAPNLHPGLKTIEYDAADMAKAADKIQNAFNKSRPLEPVKCPKCGEEFFVSKD